MDRIYGGNVKYVQGSGLIDRLGSYCENLGENVIVICDDFIMGLLGDRLEKTFESLNCKLVKFNGEASMTEVNRILEIAKEYNTDFIVGVGGGKTLDATKVVGHEMNIRVVVSPTMSSSDAPTTGIAVIYNEDGSMSGYKFVNRPDYVLVDLEVIAQAPTHTLVAGMGDALASWIEIRSAIQVGATTNSGGEGTEFAYMATKLGFDTILRDAKQAIVACDNNIVTPALANVVDANTFLSTKGDNISVCHSFVGATTQNEILHRTPHGTMCGFGILVQLVLENDQEMLTRILEFNKMVGLPLCFDDMDFGDYKEEDIMKIAEDCFDEFNKVVNTPAVVSPATLKNAIIQTDVYGKKFRDGEL